MPRLIKLDHHIFWSDLNLREGLKAKKRVTGLVLAVILSFVGELVCALSNMIAMRMTMLGTMLTTTISMTVLRWESWDWEKMNLQHVGHWRRRKQNDILIPVRGMLRTIVPIKKCPVCWAPIQTVLLHKAVSPGSTWDSHPQLIVFQVRPLHHHHHHQ